MLIGTIVRLRSPTCSRRCPGTAFPPRRLSADLPVARPTIVAVTGEGERHADVRRKAIELAARDGSALILYDWEAPTFLGAPLPTWWSGEGSEDLFSHRLDQTMLRAAGRATIADQVAEAEGHGISASGWLPSEHGPGALAAYALGQGASTIVISAALQEVGGLDALLHGTDQVAALDEATPSCVVVVVEEP